MRSTPFSLATSAAVALLITIDTGHADAGFTNNTIRGTLRFSNVNPVVLDQLNGPVNDGMSHVYVEAHSLPPHTRSATTDVVPAASRTSSPYQIDVDSTATGVSYQVAPRLTLLANRQSYYYRTAISPPVIAFAEGPVMDFSECLALVTLHFVTDTREDVPVNSASIRARALPGNTLVGIVENSAGSFSQQRIYVPTDAPVRLEIAVRLGSDTYVDRWQFATNIEVTAVCDQRLEVDVFLPKVEQLARIEGVVDMEGVFENTVDGRDDLDYADGTTVVADFGPFLNKRYAAVPGINFTVPASGPFALVNLMPSTADPLSAGYRLYANMYFRSNRQIQTFRSPALGWESNPPVAAPAGATLNLGNTFVIRTGHLRGDILLQGPPELPARPSLLRGVEHMGDKDSNRDGIPDGLGAITKSRVTADGVNRRASGATLTAAFGNAETDFDGRFDDGLAAYRGGYDLILGGLRGEGSVWRQSKFTLALYNPGATGADDFINSELTLTDLGAPELEVVPGHSVTHDIAYSFSEVCIPFRSANAPFFNPGIKIIHGGLSTDADFRGRPVHYSVTALEALGTPVLRSDAATSGMVVLLLPEGTYRLSPAITPSDSDRARILGNPIELSVGRRERICAVECLVVNVVAPACSNRREVPVAVHVPSCSNDVARVTFSLNDGPEQTLCSDCGPNPSLNFILPLPDAGCAENRLLVTAVSTNGIRAYRSVLIRHDATPPVVQCPSDMMTECVNTNRVPVHFDVIATGHCPGAISVNCNPPSGSLFPAGTSRVTCYAQDSCGNRSADCSFNVVVRSQVLSIERAVLVRWGCGVLQGADDLAGPWTDIPGAANPYCVPADQARRFYRTRNPVE